MKRMTTGLCLASAIGLAATLFAQTPTTTTAGKDHDVTVTGCLSKAAGGFMLNNARMDTGTPSSTTTASGSTTTAGSTTATGTTGTNREGAAGAPMSWMLTGNDDLEKHVGHKIEVTGKTTWDASMDHSRASTSTSTASTSTTTAKSGSEPHLDVKSIKMISSSCS
jgi:hypothetical protein